MTTSARRSSATEEGRGIWRYPAGAAVADVEGYAIDATDGFIGTVGAAGYPPGDGYLVALCGPWNGGRTLMIPAGIVRRIEPQARVIHLGCSQRALRAAPAYENDRYQDAAYRGELAAYYETLAPASRLAGMTAGMTAALRAGVLAPAPAVLTPGPPAFGGPRAG